MERKLQRKSIIQILVAVIVVGALLAREYEYAGLVLSMAAIAYYIAINSRAAVKNLRAFRRVGRLGKIKAAAYLVLVYIFIRAVLTYDIPYFLLLLIFGLEYLVYENRDKE